MMGFFHLRQGRLESLLLHNFNLHNCITCADQNVYSTVSPLTQENKSEKVLYNEIKVISLLSKQLVKVMDTHLKKFNKQLKGKTIKQITWLTDKEMETLMWYKRPIVIEFTDGSFLIPMSDDEGNDGGSMHYQNGTDSDVIYTTT